MRVRSIAQCLLIFAFLAGCGKYVSPVTRSAFDDLVAMEAEVERARETGIDPVIWNQRSGVLMLRLDDIQRMVKGSPSGSAGRDVARMGRMLRDMIILIGQQLPPGKAPANEVKEDAPEVEGANTAAANEAVAESAVAKGPADTPSEYERLSKAFHDYRKAATKKLGIRSD